MYIFLLLGPLILSLLSFPCSFLRSFLVQGIAYQGSFCLGSISKHFIWCFIHDNKPWFFRFDPRTGLLTGTKDGTLVNLFLRLFGQCSEKSLCIRLLIFQVTLCNSLLSYLGATVTVLLPCSYGCMLG